MWFLGAEFKFILVMAAIYCFAALFLPKAARFIKTRLSGLIFFIFLFNFNKYTGLFYIILMVLNYLLARLILRLQNRKKEAFAFAIIMNTLVFVVVNLYPSDKISFLGTSYALLKFIDLAFYAYFYEERASFLDIVSYILFVPIFTSGPIMAFNDYQKQLYASSRPPETEGAIKRIIIGFFKKVVVANSLYIVHDRVLAGELNIILSLTVLAVSYAIGYLDFSGYSDIAIGFSALMGIKVPENFKMPFLSPSLTIFWKNWHITLGNWVKTHITVFFKPKSRLHAALASFVIMLFIGAWHNFSLLFMFWGIWHGIFLFIEGYFNLGTVNKKKTKPLVYYARCLLTNSIVAFGCIFFYTDIGQSLKILKGLITFSF